MIQYSISTQTAVGAVDTDQLTVEINNSGLMVTFTGIEVAGNVLSINGTTNNQSGLDALIAAHDPISSLKTAKCSVIDAKTDALIALGFGFDGQTFSLSLEAQSNWQALYNFQNILTWPYGVTTQAQSTYVLTQGNLTSFVLSAVAVVATAVGSGRALKIQVMAATDKASVNAIIDTR